uniref:Uncharacterized protein n=1 Tax=Megaselia scalaris TaxID=36166 RepID=T1GXC3_MEGSC
MVEKFQKVESAVAVVILKMFLMVASFAKESRRLLRRRLLGT